MPPYSLQSNKSEMVGVGKFALTVGGLISMYPEGVLPWMVKNVC